MKYQRLHPASCAQLFICCSIFRKNYVYMFTENGSKYRKIDAIHANGCLAFSVSVPNCSRKSIDDEWDKWSIQCSSHTSRVGELLGILRCPFLERLNTAFVRENMHASLHCDGRHPADLPYKGATWLLRIYHDKPLAIQADSSCRYRPGFSQGRSIHLVPSMLEEHAPDFHLKDDND